MASTRGHSRQGQESWKSLILKRNCLRDAHLGKLPFSPHNPKVADSNPAPATRKRKRRRIVLSSFLPWPLLANRRLKAKKASRVAAEEVSLLFCGHEIGGFDMRNSDSNGLRPDHLIRGAHQSVC